MDTRIVRVAPKPDYDAFVAAMWVIFLRTPAKAKPDLDGMFNLGEIGQDREKDWERLTPYSPARRSPCFGSIETAA